MMAPFQFFLGSAVLIASVLTLVGIFRTGRFRECWTYVGYVMALIGFGAPMALWPDRFWNLSWYLAKEAIYDSLRIGVALELAFRVTSSFPGAAARLRRLTLLVLIIGASTIALAPGGRSYSQIYDWQPAITHAAIWLLGVTAFVVLFYRLPVTHWNQVLVIGLAGRLLLWSTLLKLLAYFGWSARAWVSYADGFADLVFAWALAYYAWRQDESAVVVRELRARIRKAFA
jgi:hypothetical protein